MRHEAKLRVIKRAARVSNFKNICRSVAKRHQHLLCYYIHTSMLLSNNTKTGPCKLTSINAYPVSIQLQQYQLVEESVVYTTSFVTYKGITYKLILYSYNVLNPTYCKISTIIKTEKQEIILVLYKLNTLFYDSHYHSYCIEDDISENSSMHLCNIEQNHCSYVFHIRQSFANNSKLYVIYKYIK